MLFALGGRGEGRGLSMTDKAIQGTPRLSEHSPCPKEGISLRAERVLPELRAWVSQNNAENLPSTAIPIADVISPNEYPIADRGADEGCFEISPVCEKPDLHFLRTQ